MDQVQTGRFIAELRRQEGLTQEALGQKLGVTNKTVSRWENGNYMPDVEMMQLLAQTFHVSIHELLAGERLPDEAFREKADENTVSVWKKKPYSYEKVIYRRIYIALFVVLVIGVLLLGDGYLKSLNTDYFPELTSVSGLERVKNGIVFYSTPGSREFEQLLADIAREERIRIYRADTAQTGESAPVVAVIRNGMTVERIGPAGKADLLSALTPYKELSNHENTRSQVPKLLLGASVLFLLCALLLGKRRLSGKLWLPIVSFDICLLVFAARNWAYGVAYAEAYGISGNYIDSGLSLVAIGTAVLATAFFTVRIKENQ